MKKAEVKGGSTMKNILAVIGLIAVGAIVLPAVVGLIAAGPDIVRYLKMRSM